MTLTDAFAAGVVSTILAIYVLWAAFQMGKSQAQIEAQEEEIKED